MAETRDALVCALCGHLLDAGVKSRLAQFPWDDGCRVEVDTEGCLTGRILGPVVETHELVDVVIRKNGTAYVTDNFGAKDAFCLASDMETRDKIETVCPSPSRNIAAVNVSQGLHGFSVFVELSGHLEGIERILRAIEKANR